MRQCQRQGLTGGADVLVNRYLRYCTKGIDPQAVHGPRSRIFCLTRRLQLCQCCCVDIRRNKGVSSYYANLSGTSGINFNPEPRQPCELDRVSPQHSPPTTNEELDSQQDRKMVSPHKTGYD
jgi:hypothetical protein